MAKEKEQEALQSVQRIRQQRQQIDKDISSKVSFTMGLHYMVCKDQVFNRVARLKITDDSLYLR